MCVPSFLCTLIKANIGSILLVNVVIIIKFVPFRAMCWVDFGMPVDGGDGESGMVNGQDTALRNLHDTPVNSKLKRKLSECHTKRIGRKNFDIFTFRNPALYIGHLSENSVLIIDKPWMEVVKTFAPPVDRHIFGT